MQRPLARNSIRSRPPSANHTPSSASGGSGAVCFVIGEAAQCITVLHTYTLPDPAAPSGSSGAVAVVPHDVADTTHRWPADSGVVAMMVVDVQPPGQRAGALTV